MIFTPPDIKNADALLNLADSLARILDPKERAKIAEDIKSFHALNDTEAKKHAEAKSLIEEHKAVLEKTIEVSDQNKKEQQKLASDRDKFDTYVTSQNTALSEAWNDIEKAKKELEEASNSIIALRQDVSNRESILSDNISVHEMNVKSLENEKIIFLEKESERKKTLDTLDKEISEKREIINALRKFNI